MFITGKFYDRAYGKEPCSQDIISAAIILFFNSYGIYYGLIIHVVVLCTKILA